MSYRDTLIRAMNRLVILRNDLAAIEADVVRYRKTIPNGLDAPVTAALQDEAWAWKLVIDRAGYALSYWITDIQAEIDEFQP